MFKLLYILIISISICISQSDRELALATVMDYIEGTANGEVDRLKNAFHEDAFLFTVNNDGQLVSRESKKYISLFKEGKKNNRKGQVILLDVVNDAATAIVEIVMGSRKFTDYILLLKINGNWKIIQKSYTYVQAVYKGKVLFVVSNYSTYGEHNKRTGSHFNELVKVYDGLLNEGFEVDFVSPNGGSIPLAYFDLRDNLQKTYFYDSKLMYKLKYTAKPGEVDISKYKGIFYVGGSASMFDIPDNQEIINLAKTLYEDQNGAIAAVCHGVVGLVNVKLKSGEYLVKGKRVNSFTNKEEQNSGNDKYLPFLIETKLKEHGALYYSSDNWQEHVEVSDRLITGQNPASARKLVEEMIKVIESN